MLLHGLGATGAVWSGLVSLLDANQLGRHAVLDLPGHGASSPANSYAIEAIGSAVASSLQGIERPILIGHSLGAYVALALASGKSTLNPSGVLAIGPKISWSAADLAAIKEFAAKPARVFSTEAEAVARYRKVSGLDERIAPAIATLARGVTRQSIAWRLSCDPRTALAGGSASFATLAHEARCPYVLARGERDPLVTLDALREITPNAEEIAACGHNVHVEAPASLLPLIQRLATA